MLRSISQAPGAFPRVAFQGRICVGGTPEAYAADKLIELLTDNGKADKVQVRGIYENRAAKVLVRGPVADVQAVESFLKGEARGWAKTLEVQPGGQVRYQGCSVEFVGV